MISFSFNYKHVGKYYLGDVGYEVQKGIVSSYCGIHYHHKWMKSACCIIHNHIIGVDPLDSIMSNGLHGSLLANENTSRRVQQYKGKSKKKIENGFRNGMIFVVTCGRIIMLWSDFILFILAGCCNGFFWFHIFKTSMCWALWSLVSFDLVWRLE